MTQREAPSESAGAEATAGSAVDVDTGSAPGGDTGSGALAAPLESSSRVDDVTDRLVTAIATGEYLPGQRLPAERDLAASLRAGRMTVRAALARLVDQGMIETQRGRGGGSFVREQHTTSSDAVAQRTLTARWSTLRDTSDAIGRLHGTVAEAAAENRTPADAELLRERLEGYRRAESGRASQRADELLHVAIADAAHNATLRDVLFDLEARVSISAPAHLWGGPDGMREMELRALADHEALVDAICAGHASQAASIAREHVKIDLELLERVLHRHD
ncbi:FadR/GntR family transcriptional regulator [Frigoribacterium faeni]|uniref:Transcriptional regulator n=1 Tax=Frigoribacterium faeni TaxID=145483 RepID=A0A7W3JJY9_9MICO|nr:GntR family transcriptional regulator [Frigoribacterium faeni]MBA8814220.1 DNA-binding FadR family transcriptional regulator [Frigoribacterium faeni]BFF16285.1 GntR family transcriptional regulator [Microbacterium flavescens]GEK83687.1 transcriptional regulator [Frigoribacterium faeni]